MSLIEAVTLHENIFTLPARLSSDVDDLELRKALIRSEVLIELDTKPFHKAVGNAIVRSLEQVKDPVRVIGMTKDSSESIAFEGETKSEVQDFLLLSSQVKSDSQTTSPEFKPLATGLSLNDSYDYYGPNRSSHDILSASSFQKMGKSLIGWIESNGSGAYDHCTSILRDMYYIFVSERLSIPYWPQFSRIEFSKQFPNYFGKKFRSQLFSRIAKSLSSTVAEISKEWDEKVTFIPPFSALVFHRSSGPRDLVEQVLNVRDEFSKLRKSISGLEEDRRNARSIGERKKLRLHQEKLLETAAKGFDNPTTIKLQSVLRYIPEVIKPAVAPTDPTKYGADLLLKPVELILDWWQRRPVAKIFDLGKKINKIEEYQSLINKVFGNRYRNRPAYDWKVWSSPFDGDLSKSRQRHLQ